LSPLQGLVGEVAASTLDHRRRPGRAQPRDLILHSRESREAGMVAAVVLPLLVAGRAVGVVCLFTVSHRAIAPGETKVMEAFAEHAAVALTKARLFQDIQDRRRVSEELYC
jgi:GAF domain-containing protein